MDDSGDVMVSTDDAVTSQDQSDYVTSVHLETTLKVDEKPDAGSVPEYATITRVRQHDPPRYFNHRSDSSDRREADNGTAEDKSPTDDAEKVRERDDENRIEVLDSLIVENGPKEGSNGCPPGAGWVLLGTAASVAASSNGDHGDGYDDPSLVVAKKNSEILGQFEDKPREKDECLVDCIYYTTTCCECTIL